MNAVIPCFQCDNCQNGVTSQCGGMLGGYEFTFQKDSNMAEDFEVNEAKANLPPIPDEVTDEGAAYTTDMMSTGFMDAENVRIPPDGSCAVFGYSPVGLMAVAGARMLGSGLLNAVDADDRRLGLAREAYGADVCINFQKTDAVPWIMKMTRNRGIDGAIEADRFSGDLRGLHQGDVSGGHDLEHRLSWLGRSREDPSGRIGRGHEQQDHRQICAKAARRA